MTPIKFAPSDLLYVAAYLHHGENRIQAAFRWADDCAEWCKQKGTNIHGEQIYTPMTRDGKFIQPKSNGHGYNILDILEGKR